MDNVEVIRVGPLDALFKLADHLSGFIFRGEGSYEFDFKSTLEREILRSYDNKELTEQIETDILSEFKSIVKIHRPNIDLNSNLEVISLLRHYGGPARFLDFTHSYYIALFFACQAKGTTSVIWCINYEELDELLLQKNILSKEQESDKGFLRTSKKQLAEKCLTNEIKQNFLFYTEPPSQNERLFYQKGTLLLNSNHKRTLRDTTIDTLGLSKKEKELLFKDEIKRTKGGYIIYDEEEEDFLREDDIKPAYHDKSIVKIIIDPDLKAQALMKLDRMNINHQTLFPGLEGAAKYVTRHAFINRMGASM